MKSCKRTYITGSYLRSATQLRVCFCGLPRSPTAWECLQSFVIWQTDLLFNCNFDNFAKCVPCSRYFMAVLFTASYPFQEFADIKDDGLKCEVYFIFWRSSLWLASVQLTRSERWNCWHSQAVIPIKAGKVAIKELKMNPAPLKLICVTFKVEVKSLCMPWKLMAGVRVAPLIFNVDNKWRWVFSFVLRPLYPRGKSLWCPLCRMIFCTL